MYDKFKLADRRQRTEDIESGLLGLTYIQRQVSGNIPGCITRGARPTPEQVAVYTLALAGEAQELADELGWKPWKKQPEIDKQKIMDEYADILAFVGLLGVYVTEATGCSVIELARAYIEKSQVNLDRQAGQVPGYVSTVEVTETAPVQFKLPLT